MYLSLRKVIDEIKIIDDHGHPGLFKAIDELGMPEDALFPFKDTFSVPKAQSYGFDYLEELHYEAYEKLHGFTRADLDNPEKHKELAKKYEKQQENLGSFMDEIMEAAGVEYLMVNLAVPESLQNKKSIGFIPSVDALLFPFNNEYMFGKPFSKIYLKQFEHYLKLYKKEYGFTKDNFTFEEYIHFADEVLEGIKEKGQLGYKFICGYARTTYFEKTELDNGNELFNKAKNGDTEAYTSFQNMMAWYIFRKAAMLDMPIQVHMAMIDGDTENTNPLNFKALTMDEVASKTKLVILHCGYPRFAETTTLMLAAKLFSQNNMYIDLSGRVMFGNHPKVIAKNIRNWLDYPSLWGKIMYGSDVLLGNRVIYTAAKTGRDAVYYALESAIDDGLISEQTAITIAKGILRNNAINVYNLPLAKA